MISCSEKCTRVCFSDSFELVPVGFWHLSAFLVTPLCCRAEF